MFDIVCLRLQVPLVLMDPPTNDASNTAEENDMWPSSNFPDLVAEKVRLLQLQHSVATHSACDSTCTNVCTLHSFVAAALFLSLSFDRPVGSSVACVCRHLSP